MKFPLLLALLVGGAAAFHLRSETLDVKSPSRDESLPKDVGMPRPEVEECPPAEELIPLEEEECSGIEGNPGYEGAISDNNVTDENIQCPKEEDTISLVGNSGCKTCRYLLVRSCSTFETAQSVCRRCYGGTLASIHSISVNLHIQCYLRGLNQAQVWIGGRITGSGHCTRFQWVDGSCWNFTYWAPGQPNCGGGSCVTMCTQGGYWRRSCCLQRLPFICSY